MSEATKLQSMICKAFSTIFLNLCSSISKRHVVCSLFDYPSYLASSFLRKGLTHICCIKKSLTFGSIIMWLLSCRFFSSACNFKHDRTPSSFFHLPLRHSSFNSTFLVCRRNFSLKIHSVFHAVSLAFSDVITRNDQILSCRFIFFFFLFLNFLQNLSSSLSSLILV